MLAISETLEVKLHLSQVWKKKCNKIISEKKNYLGLRYVVVMANF